MNLSHQFAGHNQVPVPPLHRADTPAAISVRPQPFAQVGSSSGTASHQLAQCESLTPPPFLSAALHIFEDPLRGFLEARPEIAKISGSRELPGEFLHDSCNALCQEIHQESALSGVEQVYVLEDRSSIFEIVKRNRLLELLLDARDPLASAFGEATLRKLTLVEDDEGFVTLFCLVLTPGSLEKAKQALNLFDESWWLDRSCEAGGKLNFDFELI